MKIQGLTIIFIIIIVPIVLVVSSYAQTQMDSLDIQMRYDTALYDSTYDGVKAFQLNTVNNKYSVVSDSMKRDVLASVNAFETSLAKNLGVSRLYR